VDRQILSLIKEILDKDLGWSNADFGRVNGAFQGAYGYRVCCASAGSLNRYGTKIGYGASITAWSLAAIGHALVGSVTGFFTARVALGWAKAEIFRPPSKPWRSGFQKKSARSRPVFSIGTNVGAILAPALVAVDRVLRSAGARFCGSGHRGIALVVSVDSVLQRAGENQTSHPGERDFILSDKDEKAANAAGEKTDRGL